MTASVDDVNMYPSIKLTTIRKVVRFFSRKITAATKKTKNICLDLIHFGMCSTFIYFDKEHYKYQGGENEEQGLEIGGYESELISDLVMFYLFDKPKILLNQTT